jgi:SAM-dependent methyltransferase
MVPTTQYDGERFPFEDKSFDLLMMIDVLHHIDNIDAILAEAVRVGRKFILIKDHFVRGWMARPTLTLMDNVSNRQFGIAIPANYQTENQWQSMYAKNHLLSVCRRDHLGLYFPPLSWVFERHLHFLQLLSVPGFHPLSANN